MATQIITPEDLIQFRIDLLADIKALLEAYGANPQKKLLSSSEVMDLLGVSYTTLYKHIRNGILNPKKLGGKLFFLSDEINSLFNNQ